MKKEEIALKLRNARLTGTALVEPLSELITEKNIEHAYEIQLINNEWRENQDEHIVGKKIGLTSKIVQQQLGVDQPDFGTLFNTMEVLNGQSISMNELMQPKVEAEIAIVLGENIDIENPSILDVISSVDYLLPSIEIVGSRIKDWNITIFDTIADNASASHYVLGHSPKTLDEIDITQIPMKLMKNQELVSSGHGQDCLGSPLNALLWLANQMIELGDPLQAGDVILTGALGPMVQVRSGDSFFADFGNLGTVSVSFD